jgi:hypothetical protein
VRSAKTRRENAPSHLWCFPPESPAAWSGRSRAGHIARCGSLRARQDALSDSRQDAYEEKTRKARTLRVEEARVVRPARRARPAVHHQRRHARCSLCVNGASAEAAWKQRQAHVSPCAPGLPYSSKCSTCGAPTASVPVTRAAAAGYSVRASAAAAAAHLVAAQRRSGRRGGATARGGAAPSRMRAASGALQAVHGAECKR